jgi:2-phosphoglycerate kinase
MAAETPAWRVLLIGGNSGSGKTTLARALGLRFGIPWAQVDDFRLALQRMTTPADQPDLHFFLATERVWQLSAEHLCSGLIGVAEVVSGAMGVVIAHHVLTPHPLILEGDGLTPAMAAARERSNAEQRAEARASHLYGQWLRAECDRHRIPALPSRPRETILDRVTADLRRAT